MSSEDVAVDIGQQQAEAIAPVQQERMVPQSEVDRIVHARVMREREHNSAGMGGMQQPQGFDRDALLKEAAAMMQSQMEEQRQTQEREQQKAQVDEIARTYIDKMAQGKEIYDDFDDVTGDFSPQAYPQVTILASQQDNLPDIMYELGKNPQKLATLHVLALSNPALARKEMTKLSQSIKKNEQALASNVKSPSPLSRLKHSAQAGQDNGKRTISDMRKDPKYRG